MSKQYVDQIIEEAIQEGLFGKIASAGTKAAFKAKKVKHGIKYSKPVFKARVAATKGVDKAKDLKFIAKNKGQSLKRSLKHKKRMAGQKFNKTTKLVKAASKKVANKLKSFLKTRKVAKAAKKTKASERLKRIDAKSAALAKKTKNAKPIKMSFKNTPKKKIVKYKTIRPGVKSYEVSYK